MMPFCAVKSCPLTQPIYPPSSLPRSLRQALLAAQNQKAQALSTHLQATQAFPFMHTISPSTPLMMAIVDASTNHMSLAVNAPYGEHFHTSGEMAKDLFAHKVGFLSLLILSPRPLSPYPSTLAPFSSSLSSSLPF